MKLIFIVLSSKCINITSKFKFHQFSVNPPLDSNLFLELNKYVKAKGWRQFCVNGSWV